MRGKAEVSWPGRAVFKSNPYTVVTVDYEPPIDGKSTYAPGESFCELSVGDEKDGMTYVVPVSTFGLLVKRLVPDGAELNRPGFLGGPIR